MASSYDYDDNSSDGEDGRLVASASSGGASESDFMDLKNTSPFQSPRSLIVAHSLNKSHQEGLVVEVLTELPPDVLMLVLLQLKQLEFPSNFESLRAMSSVCQYLNALAKHPCLFSFVVHQGGEGDFRTINEALQKTRDGDKIIVCPGIYDEHLVITKAIELISKERRKATITSSGKYVIKSESTRCRVTGFSLVQTGSPACVYCTGTYMEVVDCDITSGLSACVNIGRDAMAILRGNDIHHSQNTGIFAYSGAFGIIENNSIFFNKFPGISVTTRANLHIRGNRIYSNSQNGVHVYEKGQATIEDNDIFGNAYPGIAVKNGASPLILNNRIFCNKQNGIHVFNNSTAVIQGNHVMENGYSGISIKSGGNPLITRNIIFGNGEPGIFVLNQGRGIIEDNDVFENRQDGVLIKSGGNPLCKNNRIYNNGEDAINRRDGGGGAFLCNFLGGGEDSREMLSRAQLLFEMEDLLLKSERMMEDASQGQLIAGSQGASEADDDADPT